MIHLSTDQPRREPNPLVKTRSLAYLTFQRPDLPKAERFLLDFGLRTVSRTSTELCMRAADGAPLCYRVLRAPRPAFVGMGLTVDSREDLLRLSLLPGATTPGPADTPGGGEVVQLRDPSGFRVDVLWGQNTVPEQAHRQPLTCNLGGQRERIDATQRLPLSPPEVLRLGHVVLEVSLFQDTCAWYTTKLGFVPSDVLVLADGSPAVTFLRLDHGDQAADHHTLALAQGVMPRYGHSAYELVDTDAIGMGQRLLREKGWRHAWGIGRHILGSQIFDYWEDPWGDKHEHYCDGDLLTNRFPTGVHPVGREAMAQWGPPMPTSFSRPRLSLRELPKLIRGIRTSPDLNLSKLIQLAKIFG